jgi:4,5-dihydroxyphthalate decarboxylase
METGMSESSTLKAVLGARGATAPLIDGTIRPAGFALQMENVPDVIGAFRRMVRGLEFDVCEMALSTYLCAREHGTGFTALPVFLVRAFHHGAIHVRRRDAGAAPKSLEGHRVGVAGGYTATTGMWARSLLQEEHGVQLDRVTWVLSGDEHVVAYRAPANVTHSGGRPLTDMLVEGEIDALIGSPNGHPDIVPLVPDPMAAGLEALRTRGHYPINHLVVVRDDVLQAQPRLAPALLEAFADARQRYVAALRAPGFEPQSPEERLHRAVAQTGHDPLPYGIAANRHMLEAAIDHCLTQRIIATRPVLEQLFAAS